MLPPSEEIRRRSEERKRKQEEWKKANPGGWIPEETTPSIYEDRWVPALRSKDCSLSWSVVADWVEDWRKDVDSPDSLRTAEDIDLYQIMYYTLHG